MVNSIKQEMKELILTIDNSGKIIKFNDECEDISGYSRYETFDKKFLDFLIPSRYSKQWKKVFNSIQKNKLIDDFRLPILTKNGHEIMISWSSFPVTNSEGGIDDIGLVGKLINTWNDAKESNIGESKIVTNYTTEEYEDFYKIFKELETKNQELEKLNIELEEKIKKLKEKRSKKDSSNKTNLNLSVFTSKSKREEHEKQLNELDERKRELEALEKELNEEKRSLNEQRNWFVKWREKLESLEMEIENRNQNISMKEKMPHDSQVKEEVLPEAEIVKEEIDLLGEIKDCAAVIQRGILKEVNDSFAGLLGYDSKEIIGKSLFDFIGPEGFPGLENYYLNRLKGDSISDYETMFLTKDNDKIFVEVSTKPTIFNNDKAEIAVFKKSDKKQK